MTRDDFLPEGYRWATGMEVHMYLIQGMSLDIIAVYEDPRPEYINMFIGWAIKK